MYLVYEKRTKWSILDKMTQRWVLIAICRYHSDALNLMHAGYPGKTIEMLHKDIQCRTLYR